MKLLPQTLVIALLLVAAPTLQAQMPVLASPNQEQMLTGSDAKAVANKRMVYDFWREVFEGGHMDLAEKYMAESYIQHNPNVPTGRAALLNSSASSPSRSRLNPRSRPHWSP